MTSLVSCCTRIVNQNKWPTLLHDRCHGRIYNIQILYKCFSNSLDKTSRYCDWGNPSFLCRCIFFYSRDPRFMSLIDSPWFMKFSKMANFNLQSSIFVVISVNRDLDFFLIFWDSSMEKVFKMPPLNCYYHQIGFALKQVVPVILHFSDVTLLFEQWIIFKNPQFIFLFLNVWTLTFYCFRLINV